MKDTQKIYLGVILYLTLAVLALLGAGSGILYRECASDSSTFRARMAEISRVCRNAQSTPSKQATD